MKYELCKCNRLGYGEQCLEIHKNEILYNVAIPWSSKSCKEGLHVSSDSCAGWSARLAYFSRFGGVTGAVRFNVVRSHAFVACF